MMQLNRIFWAIFTLIGILLIAGFFVKLLYVDLLLGFLVIAVGVVKLSEELSSNEMKGRHSDINESIRYLTHMVDDANRSMERLKEKSDHRFHHFDGKRAEIEQQIEDNYDSLAKKIVQQENKLNDVTKAVVEIARRHDALVKKVTKDSASLDKVKKKERELKKSLRTLKTKTTKALKTKKAKK